MKAQTKLEGEILAGIGKAFTWDGLNKLILAIFGIAMVVGVIMALNNFYGFLPF